MSAFLNIICTAEASGELDEPILHRLHQDSIIAGILYVVCCVIILNKKTVEDFNIVIKNSGL